MNKQIIKTYIISSIVLVMIDYIYLLQVSKYYNTMITKIQHKKNTLILIPNESYNSHTNLYL